MTNPTNNETDANEIGKSSISPLKLTYDDRSQAVLQRELIETFTQPTSIAYLAHGTEPKALYIALRNIVQDVLEQTHHLDQRNGGFYLYSPTLRAYVRYISDTALIAAMCRALQTAISTSRNAITSIAERAKFSRPGDTEIRGLVLKSLIVTAKPEQIDRDSYLLLANGRIDLTVKGTVPVFIPDPVPSRVFHDHTLRAQYFPGIIDPPECLKQLFEGIGYTAPELRNALTDVMLYCLTSHNDWEKAFLFLGPGANGKSTILKFLRGVVGDEYVAATSLTQLSSNFGLGPLIHARISLSAEDGGGDFFNSATFKAVVTRDHVQVDIKHRDPITVELAAKFIFAMNEAPTISDTSHGMLRRLVVFRFDQAIPQEKRIADFDKILLSEAGAIVSWLLADHFKRYGRMLSKFDLDCRPTLKTWHSEFFLNSLETFEAFIERTISPSDDPKARISASDLMKKYRDQAAEHKWSDTITKANTFGRKLRATWKLLHPEQPELTTDKSNSTTYYVGIKFKSAIPALPAKPIAAVLPFTTKPTVASTSAIVKSGIIREFKKLDDFVVIGTSGGNFKCRLPEWEYALDRLIGPKASAAQIIGQVVISSSDVSAIGWMTSPAFELVPVEHESALPVKRGIRL